MRDVVKNHLLQVIAILAMEPPVGMGSEPLRDEKAKVFRGICPLTGRSDDEMDAYERLIGDAIKGDSPLFARQGSVELAWHIVDAILGMKTPVHEYEPCIRSSAVLLVGGMISSTTLAVASQALGYRVAATIPACRN